MLLAQGGRRSVGPVLGPKAGWAVFFAGLARQGEEGEMGGLHHGLGPKLKRNRNKNFEFLVAGLNGFKRIFEFG
jgi:hypothetical protein